MADRYLKATGDWDNNDTWSATDGGAAGATFPTASDNAYITANGNGLTLTLTGGEACIDFICSGGSTATLAQGGNALTLTGDFTILASMTWTGTSNAYLRLNGTCALTLNGQTIPYALNLANASSDVTLQDALTAQFISHQYGAINTNGQTVTLTVGVHGFRTSYGNTTSVTLGSSTLNVAKWWMVATGLTLDAGTSTIKVTQAFSFLGAGKTYNKVELNAATHTIEDDNTFAMLSFKRAGIQTITFTDGSTQTVTNMTRPNDTNERTLVGTSTAGWDIVKAGGGRVDLDYLALSYSTVTAGKFYAGANSTDTTGNSGWIFTAEPKIAMNPSSGAKIAVLPASSAKIAVGG